MANQLTEEEFERRKDVFSKRSPVYFGFLLQDKLLVGTYMEKAEHYFK